jgi:hypothetical protein
MKKKTYKIFGVALVVMVVASLLAFTAPASAAPAFPATANKWTSAVKPVSGAPGGWFYSPNINGVGPIAKDKDGENLYAYVSIGNFILPDSGDYLQIQASPGARGIIVVLHGAGSPVVWSGSASVLSPVYAGAPILGWPSGSCLAWEWMANPTGAGCTIRLYSSGNATGLLYSQNGVAATYSAGETEYPVVNACSVVSPAGTIYKSADGGHSWTTSVAPGKYAGGPVIDMVCSEENAEVLYVTDGNYVYKSKDGANNFSIIAQANLEYNLEGDCGIPITDLPITSIDVGYNGADEAIVFIGTRYVGHTYASGHPLFPNWIVGSVYWINEDTYPAEWDDLQLFCYGCCNAPATPLGCWDVYAVAASPGFADDNKAYALISTGDDNCVTAGVTPSTQVVSTMGTTCAWTFVSELYWNCDVSNPFSIIWASRFAFPNDFTSTNVMFIGVTAWTWSSLHTNVEGGDVYRVVDDGASPVAIDLNVQGFNVGCEGIKPANICSLDIMGSTDDGSLIAGAFDDYNQNPTNVYCSSDGGWTWAASKKDPTGVDRTYALWYEDTAVAGTRWCDCAFSMCCGDEVCEYFDQISLINTCITVVEDLSHAPGYIDGSSIMYELTYCHDACWRAGDQASTSLFRWDGTYWERVFSNFTYEFNGDDALMEWVEVSPDFNTTECLYLASTDFQMYRSIDMGCSWSALSYPCEPRPTITAWIVVDEETVLASSCSVTKIWKTDRHGSRPWDSFPIAAACCGVDFDLSPNIGSDGQVLFGDACGQVFISEDVGSSWDQVYSVGVPPCNVLPNADTYVQFDPSYGTGSPDPAGENMIYAAAGNVIARCNIDPDAMWDAQCWEKIFDQVCHASGIDAAGDTALYVSDSGYTGEPGSREVTIDGSIEMQCLGCPGCGAGDLGGYYYPWGGTTVYELDGYFEDGELVEIISYDLECECYDGYWSPYAGYQCFCWVYGEIGVKGVLSGAIGTASIYGQYWADDPDEVYDYYYCFGVTGIISSHLIATVTGAPGVADCAPGVWRTLNPLDFIPPGVPFSAIIEFEKLDEVPTLKTDSVLLHDIFTYWSDDLWLTTSGSSNVLWVLDAAYPTYVWVWDDPLARPVTGTAPCGDQLPATNGVTLTWTALDGATEYEIELYQYCPQCPDERLPVTVPNSTDTCAIIGGLNPGTEYFWRVRVAEGSPFLSKWSELCSFTTALEKIPELCSPVCGAKDIILTTNFSWTEVMGAASYELQIVAAGADGTADFTGATTYTSDVNALASIPGLDYSTVYYWRVRAVSGSVPGAWAVCIFTTMDEPEAPIPPADLVVNIPAEEVITPTWIWVLIGIGAALTVAVVILIVTTRRVP